MVDDKAARELRRLAVELNICQKDLDDFWPSAHRRFFKEIVALGETRFHEYREASLDQSADAPWKQKITVRAEYLVKESSRLLRSTANESTWRMRIENIILERFSVEVACRKCRNRLWRSEVESKYDTFARVSEELALRQKSRMPCTCPSDTRSQDSYEMGTSELFVDLVDELVVHKGQFQTLPKQRPDRIIALRETNKIHSLLEQFPRGHADSNASKIRDLLPSTPFQSRQDTPLFPFFALEAKCDSASDSFSDIQFQTCLPIWSFLNLQKDFLQYFSNQKHLSEPLVWFVGYRGSEWKLYGCYLSLGPGAKTICSIHYLWGGDISTKNGALQLLLIVDYITDWARDFYRVSTITYMTSLATGRCLDEVTLGPDSDIASMRRRNIVDWLDEMGSTVDSTHDDDDDPSHRETEPSVGEDKLPRFSLPNTKYGAIRPVTTEVFKLAGLRLTEHNVDSLLTLKDKTWDVSSANPTKNYSKTARAIMREITRVDDVLVVTATDLEAVRQIWTNDAFQLTEQFDEGPQNEFYVQFEYSCYLNTSWDIIRQLSYWAISKAAYALLIRRAANRKKHARVRFFETAARTIVNEMVLETFKCLRSGDSRQVLHSAMSSTLLSMYPKLEKVRLGGSSPVRYIEFAYLRAPRVKPFIEPYLRIADDSLPTPTKRLKLSSDANGKLEPRPFREKSQMIVQFSQETHEASKCSRCKASDKGIFSWKFWNSSSIPSPNVFDAVLVTSLQVESESQSTRQKHHDVSLFVLNSTPWVSEVGQETHRFSVAIESLAELDSIFHAIIHPDNVVDGTSRSILWNLPSPYRESTVAQRWDIGRWVKELKGDDAESSVAPVGSMRPWVHQQILLHFLRQGYPYNKALTELIAYRESMRLVDYFGAGAITKLHPDYIALDTFFDMVELRKHGTLTEDRMPSPYSLQGEL